MQSSCKKAIVFLAIPVAAVVFSVRSSGQTQNPIKAAKDAYNKQQPAQAVPPAQQTPQKGAAQSTTQRPAGPPTTPADTTNAPAVVLDPAKMPDIVGVHLGMEPQEAMQILRKQYPANFRFYVQPLGVPGLPAGQQARSDFLVSDPATAESPLAYLSFTMPPDKPVVWHAARYTRRIHTNRDTLLAAIRQKYGKETVALQTTGMNSQVAGNDSQIAELFWLYDERGGRVPLPPESAFPQSRTLWDCSDGREAGKLNDAQPVTPKDDQQMSTHQFAGVCGSLVVVHISIDAGPIVEFTFTEMLDAPLALRTAHAYAVWQRGLIEKVRKDDLEKSKQAKPVF